MEALRYFQTIENGQVVIDNLEKYSGKKVEIIIIPIEKSDRQTVNQNVKSVRGRLKRYANPDLISEEKRAWERAIVEKHNDL